jgi:hypothetical protein
MHMIVTRCAELNIVTPAMCGRLFDLIETPAAKTLESANEFSSEFSTRFEQYTYRAMTEWKIGRSYAKELLGIPMDELTWLQ